MDLYKQDKLMDRHINNKDQLIIAKLAEIGINVSKINGREILAKCPLHEDTNPSFYFNLDTQKFHCFAGCLKGKGLHQLIFQVTGVSQAGVPAKILEPGKFNFNRVQDKKLLPHIPLLPSAKNSAGETYLKLRGINSNTVDEYDIKYWSEENAIVIPLENVGYVLRYLDKNAPKKYKYIAGTRITDTLFGLRFLPKTLTSIILVEGTGMYLHQLGFPNTLALLHSDISQKQIKLLGGVTDNIYLMLDGDKVGKEAANRIRDLLRPRFIVKICDMPNGKDPDELTKEEISSLLRTAV